MNKSEQRWGAKVGFDIALEVMGLLANVVERIQIAGSLRRCMETVGDVELVLTPRFQRQIGLFESLFTEETIAVETGEISEGMAVETGLNLLDQRCDELLRLGMIEKRLNKNGQAIAWGKPGEANRYKALVYRGLPVDLFIVLPDRQWGPTMVLRTGPHSANQVLVTTEGVKNADGNSGTLPGGIFWQNAALWSGGRKLDTPEEADVFAALNMPYIPPHERSVEAYQLWAGRRRSRYDWMRGRKSVVPGYGWHEVKWGIKQVEPMEKRLV